VRLGERDPGLTFDADFPDNWHEPLLDKAFEVLA
jgi:hypothetical protein